MARPLSTGRPGSRMVPQGWAAAHRPTVATSWNGAVEIRDPDDIAVVQTWDADLEQMVATPTAPYFAGPARIQQLTARGQGRVVVAEDPEQVADYLVVIDADQEVPEGHLVKVTAANDDDQLVGRTLTVARVVLGTERMERDLLCTVLT